MRDTRRVIAAMREGSLTIVVDTPTLSWNLQILRLKLHGENFGLWILVVEDEIAMGRLLRQGLEEENHTVTLARDGREGLHAAETGSFDAIVLDMKYSRSDGRVTLRVAIGEHGGATIEVRDNGVGISAEDLPHVFERFFRASKDRSRQTGGMGLGLSIAQWIAQRHDGEIRVESKLGEGSVFRVCLPTAC